MLDLGTNGQHSFYQLLHQGRVVATEFIGFCKSSAPIHLDGEAISNHDELMSNFFAQPDALAYGKTISELENEGVPLHLQPHKEFSGNRPSLSLLLTELNAFSCGQLLSLYEHRVAVQGFIWGINSFDQWGVELGKVLATKVRTEISAIRQQQAAVETTAGSKRSAQDASLATATTAAANSGRSLSVFNSSTRALLSHYLAASSAEK
jgi:glucose-6-phosphate isomerase